MIRQVVEKRQFEAMRQSVISSGIYHTYGMSSFYVPKIKLKVVDMGATEKYDHPHYGFDLWTPGEIASAELKHEFPDLTKIGWRGKVYYNLLKMTWPRHFNGAFSGEGVYIDLVGAYWQFYRKLCLDTAWPRGRGDLPLDNVAVRLEHRKLARNAVIGLARTTHITAAKGTRKMVLPSTNKYLSPGLWATVQTCLHELAYLARLYGAVYIATDGYIFPAKSGWFSFETLLNVYNLEYRMVTGLMDVQGWGSYRTPAKTTLFFKKGLRTGRVSYVLETDRKTKTLDWWHKQ